MLGGVSSERSVRRVVMVAYPGAQILDVTGPLEVFARTARWLQAERHHPEPAYAVEVVAPSRGLVRASSGLRLLADRALADVRGSIDTLIVAGGIGVPAVVENSRVIDWLRRTAPRARRVASVCTGAFLLAEAGLLDGRRATTHWSACRLLAQRYPKIAVDPDPIFVRDGRVYTSAGVTAGMDLALAMVEADHGVDVALAVARALVMFLKRPGGQSQFSVALMSQTENHAPLRDLQRFILDHPGGDLSVPALARRVAMSPRHFSRVFGRNVGMTPARFVEQVRIETARRRLEESPAGVDVIAETCGFPSAEIMRRAFVRTVRVSPTQYRQRFRRV
jgi:transcriptional regulator GlxA family with amidase domain